MNPVVVRQKACFPLSSLRPSSPSSSRCRSVSLFTVERQAQRRNWYRHNAVGIRYWAASIRSAAISTCARGPRQETDATGNHHSPRVGLIEGKTGIRRSLTDNRSNLSVVVRPGFRVDDFSPPQRSSFLRQTLFFFFFSFFVFLVYSFPDAD